VQPSTSHITHVYNTGDVSLQLFPHSYLFNLCSQPIPQGACIGMTSLCSIGGFALETRCHTGQVIRYDTVQKLGWSVDIRNHPIKIVLDRILSEDAEWKPEFNGELGDRRILRTLLVSNGGVGGQVESLMRKRRITGNDIGKCRCLDLQSRLKEVTEFAL
jgi:hypothetical protein